MDLSLRNHLLFLFDQYDGPKEPLNEELASEYNQLSRNDQKELRESLVFVHFARCAGLSTDPLSHQNEAPPCPDIRAIVDGEAYYFELAEITAQPLAAAVSTSVQDGVSKFVWTSPEGPLTDIVIAKCGKSYSTLGANVDLVVYYGINQPTPKDIFVQKHYQEIQARIGNSSFKRIWVFSDRHPRRVLLIAQH